MEVEYCGGVCKGDRWETVVLKSYAWNMFE
jgi:hypothetical protein